MSYIGIDMGGRTICAGFVSKGKVIESAVCMTKPKSGKEKVYSKLTELIDDLIDNSVKGIGIGVPSILNREKGIVYEMPNIPSWKKVKLKEKLEKKYKIPVHLSNDANCFALGEKLYGKGKKYKSLVGLITGTGFGAGIVIDKKIYCGANCGAGEFGRIVFKESEIEDYCSGKFFKKMHRLKGEDAYKKALKGDKKAKKIFQEYGKNLGQAISIIANAVDPEAIVIGGSVSKSHKFYEKEMKKELKKHTYKRISSGLKIYFSNAETSAILGAAALCEKERHL